MYEKTCFCGDVKIKIPEKPLLHFMCHCNDCDKLWNGLYMGFAFSTNEIELSGHQRTFCFKGGSGQNLEVDFCGICGTRMASRPEIVDGLTYIPAGLLKGEIKFTPHVELFAYNKYQWVGNASSLKDSFDHNGTVERLSAIIEAVASHN